MRRVRMESLDIEDIDSSMLVLEPPAAPVTANSGETDWLCGHCEETLLHLAIERTNATIVFRCPHCRRFSRLRQIQ